MITTTTVLTAVARFEFTPSIPTFASIDVSAAKTADRTANNIHIASPPFVSLYDEKIVAHKSPKVNKKGAKPPNTFVKGGFAAIIRFQAVTRSVFRI
jgi:hypothetical protein